MRETGLNQSTLAEKSGVSRDTIWRVLHEKSAVSEEPLNLLSAALGKPLPVLSDISRQKPPTMPQRLAEPQSPGYLPGQPVGPTVAEVKALVAERLAECRRTGTVPQTWEVLSWVDLALRAARPIAGE